MTLDIEALSDELQKQDAENVKEIIEELIKDVDPSDVTVGVDIEGRINIFISGTQIGTINRFAIEGDDGQKTIMLATFQPESVS